MNEENNKKKSQRTLIIILLVSIAPVLLAYTAFFTGIGVPENTVNAGTLLKNPIRISDLFNRDDQDQVKDITKEAKWRLYIPVGETCNAACEANLYTTRQVHIRLSDKSARVERVALNLGGEAGLQYLESIHEAHPYLKILNVNPLRWYQWLDGSGSGLSGLGEHFYLLVDQEGYAMMFYTQKQHGNELLKDLKRALKYSIDFQK